MKLIFIVIYFLVGAVFIMCVSGCSISTLVKDCARVESQEYYKCKTLKPWE